MRVEQFSDNSIFEDRSHLFALLTAVVICVILSCCFAFTCYFGQADDFRGGQALESRINPNTCNQASLVRLEGIGPARARAIILYRETMASGDPNRIVFKKAEDLMNISGIGEKTVEAIKPFLIFE